MVGKATVYNGHPQDLDEKGCKANAIDHMGPGIATRAVLVDMPLLKNVPYLAPTTPIYPADLEAWEKFANVKIGSDAVNDVQPSGVAGGSGEAANRPVHTLSIAIMGMPLVDNGYFEDAAQEAARLKRWDFFMTVQLTKITGGTATPFNALGVF